MDSALPVIQFKDRPGLLDLGWGHPHPSALPVESWLAATEATLRASGWHALTYGSMAGPGPLIEWLTEHLRETDHGISRPAETFVTAGASHALELACAILIRPGDLVIVDSPTYHLALPIFADHGAEIVGAPADRDGIDPDATADLIAAAQRDGRRVPMLYLVPTFGNPTGHNLSVERRRALVELARRQAVSIIEDDTYRELAYSAPAPPSLWSIAEGDSVIRVGSFAKTVAPGLRLGWINAAPEFVGALRRVGYVDSGGGVNHAVALTMATLGSSGGYAEHVAQVRARYAYQRDALVGALRDALPRLEVPSPAGGWFIWLELPPGIDAGALLPVAEQMGVSFVEGSRFFVGAGGEEHVRLSFSRLDPPELAEAARRLAAAVHDHGQRNT